MIEYAAVAVGIAFVVFIGYLIPTILQVKRTVNQSEKLLMQLNSELPLLLKDLRATTENVHIMTIQARQGVDRASQLLDALGEVGQTVHNLHGTVRGRSSALMINLARILAGIKAASSTIKQRVHKEREGGPKHG